MIRMNRGLAKRWNEQRMAVSLATVTLQPRLLELVQTPFLRKDGCTLIEGFSEGSTGPEAFDDRTSYEAFINKVHVDDYIDAPGSTHPERVRILLEQGAKSALALADRLQGDGRYRVILSLDPEQPTATLRFYERREGEMWAADDPDEYPLEEILMIDVPHAATDGSAHEP